MNYIAPKQIILLLSKVIIIRLGYIEITGLPWRIYGNKMKNYCKLIAFYIVQRLLKK